MAEQETWKVRDVIDAGIVSDTDLSAYTDEILVAMSDSGRTLLATTSGRIAAIIRPTTLEGVALSLLANNRGLRDSLSTAEDALAVGDTVSFKDIS